MYAVDSAQKLCSVAQQQLMIKNLEDDDTPESDHEEFEDDGFLVLQTSDKENKPSKEKKELNKEIKVEKDIKTK